MALRSRSKASSTWRSTSEEVKTVPLSAVPLRRGATSAAATWRGSKSTSRTSLPWNREGPSALLSSDGIQRMVMSMLPMSDNASNSLQVVLRLWYEDLPLPVARTTLILSHNKSSRKPRRSELRRWCRTAITQPRPSKRKMSSARRHWPKNRIFHFDRSCNRGAGTCVKSESPLRVERRRSYKGFVVLPAVEPITSPYSPKACCRAAMVASEWYRHRSLHRMQFHTSSSLQGLEVTPYPPPPDSP